MDRKKRIQDLQRKNRIKQLINELKGVFNQLDNKDFLSADKTSTIQTNVISIMNSMDEKETSEKLAMNYDYKKWIKDGLKKRQTELNTELVVYLTWKQETFAITLCADEIFHNIDYVISMSSIANNGSSFIITSNELDVGLCLWRTEYEIMGYQW